jgi:hypothetical protein
METYKFVFTVQLRYLSNLSPNFGNFQDHTASLQRQWAASLTNPRGTKEDNGGIKKDSADRDGGHESRTRKPTEKPAEGADSMITSRPTVFLKTRSTT